jgi:hypothetical protein
VVIVVLDDVRNENSLCNIKERKILSSTAQVHCVEQGDEFKAVKIFA